MIQVDLGKLKIIISQIIVKTTSMLRAQKYVSNDASFMSNEHRIHKLFNFEVLQKLEKRVMWHLYY